VFKLFYRLIIKGVFLQEMVSGNSIIYALLWICTLISLTIAALAFENTKKMVPATPSPSTSSTPTTFEFPDGVTIVEDGQLRSYGGFADGTPIGTSEERNDARFTHEYFKTSSGVVTTKTLGAIQIKSNSIDLDTLYSDQFALSSGAQPGYILKSENDQGSAVWVEANSDSCTNHSVVIGTTVTDALNTLSSDIATVFAPPVITDVSQLITATGDLVTRSTSDTVRLGVGANGFYLKSDPNSSVGLSWSMPLGSGDVAAPVTTDIVDNMLPVFDTTSGKILKSSTVTLESTTGTLQLSGTSYNGLVLKAQLGTTPKSMGFHTVGNLSKVGLQAPVTVPVDTVWTLPSSAGASGETLHTDGSKNLSWQNSGTGDILGPGSSTANGLASYADTSGTLLLASSTVMVSNSGGGTLTLTGTNADGLVLSQTKALKFTSPDSSNSVSFKAAETIFQNTVWTLPDSDGPTTVPHHVLTTNGAGELSWAAVGTGDVIGPTAPSTVGGVATFAASGGGSVLNSSAYALIDDVAGTLTLEGGTSANGILLLGSPSEEPRSLRFRELSVQGNHTIGFKSSDEVTEDVVWTLPVADGGIGLNQTLTTDGNGVLSWTSVGVENEEQIGGILPVQVPGDYASVNEAVRAGATAIQVVSNTLEPNVAHTMMSGGAWTREHHHNANAYATPSMDSLGQMLLYSYSGMAHSDLPDRFTERTYYFRLDTLGAVDEIGFYIFDHTFSENPDLVFELPFPVSPTNFLGWGKRDITNGNYHPDAVDMGSERSFQEGDVFEMTFDGTGNVTFDLIVGSRTLAEDLLYPVTVQLPSAWTSTLTVAVINASQTPGNSTPAKISTFEQETIFLPGRVQYQINVVEGVLWDLNDVHVNAGGSAGLRISGGGEVSATTAVTNSKPVFSSYAVPLVFEGVILNRHTGASLNHDASNITITDCTMNTNALFTGLNNAWVKLSRNSVVERCVMTSLGGYSIWFGGSGGVIRNSTMDVTSPNNVLFKYSVAEEPTHPSTLIENVFVKNELPFVHIDRRMIMRNCQGSGIKLSWAVSNFSGALVPRNVLFDNCVLIAGDTNNVMSTKNSTFTFKDCHLMTPSGYTTTLGVYLISLNAEYAFTTIKGCLIDGLGDFEITSGYMTITHNVIKTQINVLNPSKNLFFINNFIVSNYNAIGTLSEHYTERNIMITA
jgi:hypothetical protein